METIKITEISAAQSTIEGARLLGITATGKEKLFDHSLLKGEKGVGIRSIGHETIGDTLRLTITLTDGSSTSFDLHNGHDGENGKTGDGFAIAKVYATISKMQADSLNIQEGKMVAVVNTNTSPMTADVYLRSISQTANGKHIDGFSYLTNLSDASVIKGEKGDNGRTPIFRIGNITTSAPNTEANVTATTTTQANGDVVVTLDFTIPQGEKGNVGGFGEKGEKGDKGEGLTDAQATWINAKMQAELGAEATSKLTLVQTNTTLTRYADTDAEITISTTITIKFDGTNIQPDNHDAIIAAGWTNSAIGVYTKSLTAANGTIATQAFNYTPQDGIYQGIAVTKSSATKSINVVYPAWHGFVDTNNISNANTQITNLARIVAKLTQTTDLNNQLSDSGYYWILTHNSATATQLGSNILDAPQNLTISINGFTLNGYKLYVSTKSAAAGGKFGNVALTINI